MTTFWERVAHSDTVTVCSLCNLFICNFSLQFCFQGQNFIFVLFATVPGHCLLFFLFLFCLFFLSVHCDNKERHARPHGITSKVILCLVWRGVHCQSCYDYSLGAYIICGFCHVAALLSFIFRIQRGFQFIR